jgi:hypothetical protein
MSTLAVLQSRFQAFVESGRPDIVSAIVDGPRVDAATRLGIYAFAYRSRLTEVLETDFPALKVLAGDELFESIAHSYIARFPSDHPNARWFGRHLLSFLMDTAPFDSQPVLAEMAGFEWAMSLAFDAADEPVLAVADLAGVPGEQWPSLTFKMHPSLQPLELRWNVPAFWSAVHQEASLPVPASSPAAVPWIVWRRDLTTYFRSLPADETAMLDAACGGANFSALCEVLMEWHAPEVVPVRAIECVKGWIEAGFVSRCGVSA